MAATPTATESAQLAAQHRQAQLRIRAAALSAFTVLWPLWKGDQKSFLTLATATVPLARVYRRASAVAAASYYQAARQLEQIAGDATPSLASVVNVEQLMASLFVTGQVKTREALSAGQSPEQAMQTALVRLSGAVTRHVLNGSRDTILQTVEKDRHAAGWARLTDGNPCPFCLTLASRGAVYKSEETADFQAHDACACHSVPVWDGSWSPDAQRWLDIYDAAQDAGIESGLLQHGENSSRARLNAVRRYLASNPIT
jgi:hypothetical protein